MQGAALGDDFRTVQRRAIRTVPQSAKIFLHGAAPCEKCCLMLRHAKTFLHCVAPCKNSRTVLLRAKKLCLIQAKFLRTVQHRAKKNARCNTMQKKLARCGIMRKFSARCCTVRKSSPSAAPCARGAALGENFSSGVAPCGRIVAVFSLEIFHSMNNENQTLKQLFFCFIAENFRGPSLCSNQPFSLHQL